jgi:hypothetical protein
MQVVNNNRLFRARRGVSPAALARVAVTALLAAALSACPDSELHFVLEDRAEALMCVRGSSAEDVWAVGADLGSGPLVLHWDGRAWEQLDSGAEGDVWWVHPGDDAVFLAGSGGLLLEYERSSGAFSRVDGIPDTLTFFGVWGASDDDVWAVGGSLGASPPAIWRNVSGTWAAWQDPGFGPGAEGEMYFKVEGRSATDLWIVGRPLLALHWDGTALSGTELPVDESSAAPLFTVSACGGRPAAVGGSGNGLLFEWDGSAWQDRSPDFASPLNGVCGCEEPRFAVGQQASVYERADGAWTEMWQADPSRQDFHACWVDDEGGLWAVGGHVISDPLDQGMLAYGGPQRVKAP